MFFSFVLLKAHASVTIFYEMVILVSLYNMVTTDHSIRVDRF